MGKILALDIGTRRVGWAVSDQDRTMAFPRGVFPFTNRAVFLKRVADIVDEEKIFEVVCGVPLGQDNEETPGSEHIRRLGGEIRTATGAAVYFVDETGTSREALKKIPFRRDRRPKGSDDALAAQIILERYLQEVRK